MKRFLLLFSLLAIAAVSLVGCGGQLTAQDIVQHMRDTAAQTNSAHLVMAISGQVDGAAANATLGGTNVGDMKGDVTLEVWYQKPNLLKVQILSSSKPEYAGAMLVHDGTNLWAYDPSHKMAYKLDTAALRELAGKANIPADLQDMLANPDLESAIDRVLALTDYTVGANEKVGAYQTYRLDLKPKADSPIAQVLAGATGTLWVDQTTWVPVKVSFDAKQGQGHLEMTTLEMNPTLSADTFHFTLPQGGHVVDLSGMTPRSMTLAEARQTAKAAGFSILEPAVLPDGATLVQVMASRGIAGNGASVIMNYSAAGGPFWISELNGASALGQDNYASAEGSQTVTVRGVEGHFAAHAEKTGTSMSVLWWKESGSHLTVAIGGQLDQATMLKIAAGLK